MSLSSSGRAVEQARRRDVPDVGRRFERSIPYDGRLFNEGDIIRLREWSIADGGPSLIADPDGDHRVLEHIRLTNMPWITRVTLVRLR